MHSPPQQWSSMAKNQRTYPAVSPSNSQPGSAARKTTSPSNGQAGGAARKISLRPYVFKLPKDKIQSAPPQRPSIRYSRCRRNPCCLCIAWFTGMLILFLLLVAIAIALFCVLYSPELPKYSLDSISVERFNLSKDHTLSSELVVAVRAQNPNKKIGIYYGEGSRLTVSYSGWEIGSGSIPIFYQGHRNITVVQTMLTASGVPFSAGLSSFLNADQTRGSVPLYFEAAEPFRLKVRGLKIPHFSVRLRCSLRVNSLAVKQAVQIQDQNCSLEISRKI